MNKLILFISLILFPFSISAQDIKLDFTDSLRGSPGESFSFEINTSDLTGLGVKNFSMRIQYDERLMNIETDGIIKGNTIPTKSSFSTELIYGNIIVNATGNDFFVGSGNLFTVEGHFTEFKLDSLSYDSLSYGDSTYVILNDSTYFLLGDSLYSFPDDSSISGFYNPKGMEVIMSYFGPGKYSSSPTLPLEIPVLLSKYPSSPTTLENEVGIPTGYELKQNYPNPFNPTTQIGFSLPKSSNVQLQVFNVMGHLVETIVDRRMNSGYHMIEFDGNDLSSGLYVYRIITDEFVNSKTMILLK